MKENMLKIFILFLTLRCIFTEFAPVVFLPSESIQLIDNFEQLLQTGLLGSKQSVSQESQCVYTKSYNKYIFQSLSYELLALRTELEKNRKIHDQRRDLIRKIEDAKVYGFFEKIWKVHESFRTFVDKIATKDGSVDTKDLCNYANNLISLGTLENDITNVRREILDASRSGSDFLLMVATRYVDKKSATPLCGIGTTPTEYLYSLYSELLSVEIETYITESFLFWYLHSYNGTDGCQYWLKTPPSGKMADLHRVFQQKMKDYTEKFHPIISNVVSSRISCNPSSLERDVTFIEMEGTIQAVVMPASSNRPYCSQIDSIGLNRGDYCSEYPLNYYCLDLPRSCPGRIYHCSSIKPQIGFCVDNSPSPRRYKWIAEVSDGPKETCPKENFYQIWNGYPAESCVCRCIDNQPDSMSTHIVNLQNVEADVEENKVVTGVRIIVEYRVLNLQIQQGTLTNNWRVENVTWKPVNDISEEIYSHRTKRPMRGGIPKLVANVDYHIISADEAFNIDEIKVPLNHVLTGVKFHYGSDRHLQIAVLSREFNPIKCEIENSDGPNIVEGAKGPRTEWSTRSHTLTGVSTMQERTDFPGKVYVTFAASDWLTDSGQTTLPLFDGQPLTSSPPTALGGFGLVHKENPNMGIMFLSPKLHSLDYSAYMRASLLSSPIKRY